MRCYKTKNCLKKTRFWLSSISLRRTDHIMGPSGASARAAKFNPLPTFGTNWGSTLIAEIRGAASTQDELQSRNLRSELIFLNSNLLW